MPEGVALGVPRRPVAAKRRPRRKVRGATCEKGSTHGQSQMDQVSCATQCSQVSHSLQILARCAHRSQRRQVG